MKFKILLNANIVFLLVFVSGCANYASRIRGPRYNFEAGQYELAAADLKKYADSHDKDELLYLMDLGIVYHTAGNYAEAIKAFLAAQKIAQLNDYTSVTQEVGSVVFSDETKVYKGEDFEKILINVYLAIDYTMLGQWDDALVECRQVNHKLDIMIREGKLPYEQNSFAKYLAASLFEARAEYNDAFVDYRTVQKWMKDFSYLPGPLLRMADKLKALQELAQYKKIYPDEKKYRLEKGEGEVLLLLEQGRAPYKVEHPNFRLIPKFVRNYAESGENILRDSSGKHEAQTEILFNIEKTAIDELAHRIAMVTTKKIGGLVVKRAVGVGVEKLTNSKELGLLTTLLLFASDQADLRSWTTLPASLKIARLTLPAGTHNLVLNRYNDGQVGTRIKTWEKVQVKAGKISFLNYRLGH